MPELISGLVDGFFGCPYLNLFSKTVFLIVFFIIGSNKELLLLVEGWTLNIDHELCATFISHTVRKEGRCRWSGLLKCHLKGLKRTHTLLKKSKVILVLWWGSHSFGSDTNRVRNRDLSRFNFLRTSVIMSSRYSGTAWRLHAGGLGNELNHGVHNRHRGKTFAHVPRCPSISFPVKSVSSVSGVVACGWHWERGCKVRRLVRVFWWSMKDF